MSEQSEDTDNADGTVLEPVDPATPVGEDSETAHFARVGAASAGINLNLADDERDRLLDDLDYALKELLRPPGAGTETSEETTV